MGKEIENHRKRVWRDPYEYGRIRLYDHTSWRLREILNRERLRLYIERKAAQSMGSSVTSWNRDIAHVTQILDEVNRLRKEKGWITASEYDDDEPERRDEETTGPLIFERSPRPVGGRSRDIEPRSGRIGGPETIQGTE